MTAFKDHPINKRVKALVTGDPGSGKTTLLASLANAGYNLRIMDFDAGLDILRAYLTPEGTDRTKYVTLTDSLNTATAFNLAYRLLSSWKVGEEDLGPVKSWGEDTVLAVDTITRAGDAALRRALAMSGKKFNDQASQPEWGTAIRDVEFLISYLTSEEVKCNVVFNSHLKYVGGEDGNAIKTYPHVVGSVTGGGFPTRVGGYFNTIIRVDEKAKGARVLRTISDHKMSLKNPAPKVVLPEEEPDLAKLFAKIKENA